MTPMTSCENCGDTAYSSQHRLCLTCALTKTTSKKIRFALALRQKSRQQFHPKGILRWAQRNPDLIDDSLSVRNTLIKCCEQLRWEFANAPEPEALECRQAADNVSISEEIPAKPHKSDNMRKLLTALSHVTGGNCLYCQKPLVHSTADALLPIHLQHTGIDTSRIRTFWRVIVAAELAVPACAVCNHRKGIAELRGLRILRALQTRKLPIRPHSLAYEPPFQLSPTYPELDLELHQRFAPPPPGIVKPPVDTSPITEDQIAQLAKAILPCALRVSSILDLRQPHSIMTAWNEQARLLVFLDGTQPAPEWTFSKGWAWTLSIEWTPAKKGQKPIDAVTDRA